MTKLGTPKLLPHGIGRQFVKIYRGLNNMSLENLNTSNAGVHWTQHKDAAMSWITGGDKQRDNGQMPGFEGTSGVLLEGTTHRRNIETNPKKLNKVGAFAYGPEKESTIKSGRKVKISKVSKFRVKEQKDDYNVADLEETQEFAKPVISKVNKNNVRRKKKK